MKTWVIKQRRRVVIVDEKELIENELDESTIVDDIAILSVMNCNVEEANLNFTIIRQPSINCFSNSVLLTYIFHINQSFIFSPLSKWHLNCIFIPSLETETDEKKRRRKLNRITNRRWLARESDTNCHSSGSLLIRISRRCWCPSPSIALKELICRLRLSRLVRASYANAIYHLNIHTYA